MSSYVFALSSATIRQGKRTVRLSAGEAWDADDELVKSRPDLFSDSPPTVRTLRGERPVEQATAAPGEKRATKRSAKRG